MFHVKQYLIRLSKKKFTEYSFRDWFITIFIAVTFAFLASFEGVNI